MTWKVRGQRCFQVAIETEGEMKLHFFTLFNAIVFGFLILQLLYIQQRRNWLSQTFRSRSIPFPSVVPLVRTCRALLLHALAPSQLSRPLLGLSISLVWIPLFTGLFQGFEGSCFVLRSRC